MKTFIGQTQQTKAEISGHVERMPDCRIPKMIMHGGLDLGQRIPGSPLKSFKQSLKDDLKFFDLW
jgi:hypothetical protein